MGTALLSAVTPATSPAAVVVVPKGRLLGPCVALFERAGLPPPRFAGRRLELRGPSGRFFLARSRDIPLYLRGGAAELGVVGRDVLLEDPAGLEEVADLGFGRCRLVLAGPAGLDLRRPGLRVATRYPAVAARYLAGRQLSGQVVALGGAVEAAVGAGLADAILDVCETGRTLEAHALVVLDTVAASSARLVAATGRPLGAPARALARSLREAARLGA